MYTKLSLILFESVQWCLIQYLPVFYYFTYSHHILTYHQAAPSHHLYSLVYKYNHHLSSVKMKKINNKIFIHVLMFHHVWKVFKKCSIQYEPWLSYSFSLAPHHCQYHTQLYNLSTPSLSSSYLYHTFSNTALIYNIGA